MELLLHNQTIIDMAKATLKKDTSTKAKAATPNKPVVKKAAAPSVDKIEKACSAALDKLRSLNLDPQLQSDIEWCLGSYRSDNNPIGLYEMAQRALEVFKGELARKTKGVTAKMVSDLEKAIAKS
jgi:hypothetical protein